MAQLKLHNLTCDKNQDGIGKDEIVIRVDGVKVGGPYTIGHSDPAIDVNITRSFTGSVMVRLDEQDGASNDDFLGERKVSDSQVGSGTRTLTFDDLAHALYHLTYSVVA